MSLCITHIQWNGITWWIQQSFLVFFQSGILIGSSCSEATDTVSWLVVCFPIDTHCFLLTRRKSIVETCKVLKPESVAPMQLTSQNSKWDIVTAAHCSRFCLLHCCSRSAATFRLSRIWERRRAINLSPELWWICSGDCWATDLGISSCQSTGLCLMTR